MKKLFAGFLAVAMLLTLAACSSGSIIGKWAFGGATYEFKDDNTVSISINGALNYDGTYETDGDKLTVTVSGLLGETTKEFTYKVKGDTLTLEGDVTFTGTSMSMDFTKE